MEKHIIPSPLSGSSSLSPSPSLSPLSPSILSLLSRLSTPDRILRATNLSALITIYRSFPYLLDARVLTNNTSSKGTDNGYDILIDFSHSQQSTGPGTEYIIRCTCPDHTNRRNANRQGVVCKHILYAANQTTQPTQLPHQLSAA